jgi:hypothetical protein
MIEKIWSRITSHAGDVFTQIRGKKFSYAVEGDYIDLETTNQKISKKDFEAALELVPLSDTVSVQHLRGPSYIYAILMDERIRQKDW